MARVLFTALALCSLNVFAESLNFTGDWEASSSSTQYADQRGFQANCPSGVKVIIDHRSDQIDLRVDYDCGVAPGGDHAVPYFMRGWSPLSIEGQTLKLNGSSVGNIDDKEFSFESSTSTGSYPNVTSRVRFWAESIHPQWLFFEHITSLNGNVVRYVRAHMGRTR